MNWLIVQYTRPFQGIWQFRDYLIDLFKHMFSVFKQYYIYYHIIFYLHVFSHMFLINKTQVPNTPRMASWQYTSATLSNEGITIIEGSHTFTYVNSVGITARQTGHSLIHCAGHQVLPWERIWSPLVKHYTILLIGRSALGPQSRTYVALSLSLSLSLLSIVYRISLLLSFSLYILDWQDDKFCFCFLLVFNM